MSFPVQIVIHGSAVRATVEAVCRRLGGGAGAVRLAWPALWDDQPDPAGRLEQAARRMLEASGGRGEGGWGQLVVADSVEGLAAVASALRGGARDAHRWLRVGVVLGDPAASESLPLDVFEAVHLVPTALGGRRLTGRDRVQIAGNLLGLLLELARLDDARRTVRRFVEAYPGASASVAMVARFNAPAIRHVLAARLAASVTGRMVEAMKRTEGSPLGPGGREAAATGENLTALGGRRNEQQAAGTRADTRFRTEVLGELTLPEAVFVNRTLAREAIRLAEAGDPDGAELDDQAGVLVSRLAMASTRAASGWLAALRAEVDRALAAGSFEAVEAALEELEGLDARIGRAIDQAGGEAGKLAALTAPRRDAVVAAEAALARARADDAKTTALYGAWALGAAVLAAAAVGPFLPAASGPLLAWLPGGAFTAVGAGALSAGAAVGSVQRRGQARRLAQLAERVVDARAAWRASWSRAIADHLAGVGSLLERRALTRLRDGVGREARLLRAIVEAVVELEQRFRREGAAPLPGGQPFDAYVRVDSAFYDAAALSAPPEELYRRAEAWLGQPSWRTELPFMDGDQLLRECGEAFADFAEGVPFARREDLRAAVVAPTRAALAGMLDQLERFFPAGEPAGRALVVPQGLMEAVPNPVDDAVELWPGVSDLFGAVIRRLS